MCVSSDLLLHALSSNSSLFVFLSFRTVSRDRELSPLFILFCMIEDTLLSFRALFYVIEDVLFLLALRFILHRRWWLHAHVCMCASVPLDTFRRSLGFFFLVSGKGYTTSLSLHKKNEAVPSKNRLFFGYYILYHSFVTTPCIVRVLLSVVSPSMFFPSPSSPRSSSFNFVHFCFLNYFVSSIRWTHS